MISQQLLLAGGVGSALAAFAHLGCIVFGATWYRFFGAGEAMAQMADRGSLYPALVTLPLVVVLAIWSWVAFSAANIGPRLPLLPWLLSAIAFVFLMRALAAPWLMPYFPDNSLVFWWVSSLICGFLGACYAAGAVTEFLAQPTL